jgi:hypothetical protein
MIETLRSGAQTGGDWGAVVASQRLHLPLGGWAPRGYLQESADGWGDVQSPWLADLGFLECPVPVRDMPPMNSREWQAWRSAAYATRTEGTARASDATLWFGTGDSRGYGKTKRSCDDYERSFLSANGKTPSEVRAWLMDNDIGSLNIAGNRASKQPTPPGGVAFHDRIANFLAIVLKDFINDAADDDPA